VLCLAKWSVAISDGRVVSSDVVCGDLRSQILSTAPQLRISQKVLGTLHEDGNVMPKHVGATIHN
jgi:predicted RNA methylase